MTEREAFGLELRRVRERKGLTLEEVCERTKVSISYFSGLERGDISRWPAGIFRRAFIRGYAATVGLDPEGLVAQFGRIFPDPSNSQKPGSKAARAANEPGRPATEGAAGAGGAAPGDAAEPLTLRLVLDPSAPLERPPRGRIAARRALAGVIDVLLPLAAAGVVAFVLGGGWFWITAALIALVGHAGFFGLTGSTPGVWLLRVSRGHLPSATPDSPLRRASDFDRSAGGRRHVPRHPSSRPSGPAHRLRH